MSQKSQTHSRLVGLEESHKLTPNLKVDLQVDRFRIQMQPARSHGESCSICNFGSKFIYINKINRMVVGYT